MKVHLPATVAMKPNRGNICIAGHRLSAAGRRLHGVIHQGGDVRGYECDMGIKNLDGRKSALLMKLLDESQDLIAVPYLLFDVGEIGQKQL